MQIIGVSFPGGAISMIILTGTGIADGMVNGATGRLVDYHDGTNDHRSLMITLQECGAGWFWLQPWLREYL